MRLWSVLLVAMFAWSAEASPVRLGADAGLFFRGEAGGNRTVLPTLAPRLSLQLPHRISAVAVWPVAYHPAGDGSGAVSTLHHRLLVRAEYAWPVRAASFYAGVGAGLVFTHAWLWDREEAVVSSTTVRVGPAVAAGVDVAVSSWRFRLGLETAFAAGRRDVSVVLGATLPVGGER